MHRDLTRETLIETETLWSPVRLEAVRRLFKEGRADEIPEHFHWDWAKKVFAADLLAHTFFGVESDGEMQGLMMTMTVPHLARIPPDQGKPLVYIDFIESAPWNVKKLVTKPRYGGVGVVLIRAAVNQSVEEGFRGRLGLHALPQSEAFYSEVCRMTALEKDRTHQDLWYYEMTAEQATKFLWGES